MRILRHTNTSFRRLYQCQSKIYSTFLSKIIFKSKILDKIIMSLQYEYSELKVGFKEHSSTIHV